MPDTERSKEFTVSFGPGVADVMLKAEQMVAEARAWAAGSQWAADMDFTYESHDEWLHGYQAMQDTVAEMELSWLRNFVRLIRLASGIDGDLRFWWDSERSLYWRHDKTGYHGGLIWHASYAKKGTVPLKVGSWSVHT